MALGTPLNKNSHQSPHMHRQIPKVDSGRHQNLLVFIRGRSLRHEFTGRSDLESDGFSKHSANFFYNGDM